MENPQNTIVPQQTHDQSEAEIIDLNGVNNIQLFKQQKKESRCNQLKKIMNSIIYQIIITIFTIFILFSDQIRTLTLTKNDDFAFDIVQISVMCIFLVELIINCVANQNYFCSFFFWLDFLSTITIVMDINMFTDYIYSNSSSTSTFNISKIASQSKASRAATRAVKIVRLIRLIRVVKLYKAAVQANQIKLNLAKEKLKQKKKKVSSQKISTNNVAAVNNENNQNKQNFNMMETGDIIAIKSQKNQQNQQTPELLLLDTEMITQIESKQSKISRTISDATIKKVIIIVLILMLVSPSFDPSLYVDTTSSMDFFINSISNLMQNPSTNLNDINKFASAVINDHIDEVTPLVFFSTPFNQLPYYINKVVQSMRFQDNAASTININVTKILMLRSDLTINASNSQTQIIAILNNNIYNNYSAYFDMSRTLFICLALGVLLNYFTDDTNTYIIQPIQYMIQKVKNMAMNPTKAANELIQQNQYQTAIVHNVIMKIGSLLSIVFGNAGAEIIGTNMMRQGQMNPLTKGKKKCAIFGFCDIRNFTDATQVLQEDIMVFVNQIGQIVHSSVYRYGGSANKNIGDAFLLVWKIPEDKYKVQKNNDIKWSEDRYINIQADFSLLSFIKIIVKIHKQPKILKYRYDNRLLQRLGKDYKVKMGFGLHIGWAIQGAIGSEYKIDASYLSPNVNMASRLQAATKQYDVPILISSYLFQKLTPQMKQFCRNIDRVTVKGSNQPIGLYTVDLDLDNISPPSDKTKKYASLDQMPDVEFKKQLNMEYLGQYIDQYDAYTFIQNKKQLRQVLMPNYGLHQFRTQFELGFDNYINGRWDQSVQHFNEVLKIKDDGPTKTLLSYILENSVDGLAPSSWKNYRQLTQK